MSPKPLPHTLHYLNDVLRKSEKFTNITNKLFDDLVIPPGLCVNKNKSKPNLIDHSNCKECVQKDLYSNLIKLVQENNAKQKTIKNKKKVNIKTNKKVGTKKKR
jgi:hypothetical protein